MAAKKGLVYTVPDHFRSTAVDLRFGIPVIKDDITPTLGPRPLAALGHKAVTISSTFPIFHDCKGNWHGYIHTAC